MQIEKLEVPDSDIEEQIEESRRQYRAGQTSTLDEIEVIE